MELAEAKILIVDDHPTIRKLISDCLAKGCGVKEIRSATDGTDAFKVLKAFSADLVIADLDMEPLSGLRMLNLIRQGRVPGVNRFVPVLMLSRSANPQAVHQSMEAGASAFIAKPFTAKVLASRVTTCLSNRPDFIEVPDAFGRGHGFFGPLTGWAEKTILPGRLDVKRLKPG